MNLEMIRETYGDLLYPTGYEDCIIGVVLQSDKTYALLMDYVMIIQKLIEDDGMTEDDAAEYFEFNIAGAYFENGPAYLYDGELYD